MAGVEYQVTKVDPTDPHTKGAVYQVHEVSEEVAATLGGKVYRARIIKDPTAPTVVGKVYQIVLIEDPSDPAVKGKVYNAILTGDSAAVVVGPAVSPLVLQGAIANSLQYVKAFGGTEQNGTPTPDALVDIVSNNGVLKVSPNLFDKNASYALFDGYINNVSVGENTTLMAYSGGDKTIIIKVVPNTTYTVTRATDLGSLYERIRCTAFTTLPSNGSTGVVLYNLSSNTQQANATFTTLSDTQYVAINVRNSGAVGDDWTQFVDAFQLEQGSTATQYRPYGQIYTDGTVETIKDSLNNTATAEMLLKVGDYQDEQEILSGTVTRKIGVKVLDGTEDWTQGAASPTFKASLPVMDSEYKDAQDILCSHFKPVKTHVTSAVNDNQCAMFTPGSAATYDKLVIGKYDMPNLTAWKQWLADQYAAGTPVIVIYPLATPTTESVAGQTLQVKTGDNVLEITQASLTGLELEAEYQKG